jgi:hypothetical protein
MHVIFHFSGSEKKICSFLLAFELKFYMICSRSIRELLLVNLIKLAPFKTVYVEIGPIPFERSDKCAYVLKNLYKFKLILALLPIFKAKYYV